jgi:hypothetical protein
MVSDLRENFADPASAVVGAEFVGTSVSSNGDQDQAAFHAQWDPLMPDNPWWTPCGSRRLSRARSPGCGSRRAGRACGWCEPNPE